MLTLALAWQAWQLDGAPCRAETAPQVPTSVVVQPGGLTSQDVAGRAVQASASLSQKRAELEAANARMQATRRQLVPQLTVKGSYTRLSPLTTNFGNGFMVGAGHEGMITTGPCPGPAAGTNCVLDSAGDPVQAGRTSITFPTNNYALNASVIIPLSDSLFRFSHALAVASKDRDAANYALEAERLKVRSDARVLYFNWVRTHGQVSIAAQACQQTQARLVEAKTAFELGALSQADVLKVEALVANALRALQDTETGRELARRQLAIVMDDHAASDYQVGEEVPSADAKDADLGSDDELVNGALARRLELKSVEASARSLTHAVASLKVTRAPRVDAVGQVDYGNPNQRYFPPTPVWRVTWSVGLVASWNLSDAYVAGGRVREVVAKREALLAQGEQVAEGIAREIAGAQAAVKSARAALAAADVNLGAQQEGYRVASEAFALGKVTATDLVDAESDLFNARLGLLDGRIDMAIALIRLEHALGNDGPGR
ncbi:MAG: TolC family protein [Myxococcales bacterium]